MGLRQMAGPSLHARLHAESPPTNPTHTQEKAKPTVSTHTHQIWSQKAICHTKESKAPPLNANNKKSSKKYAASFSSTAEQSTARC
jgi:hypothetical protein